MSTPGMKQMEEQKDYSSSFTVRISAREALEKIEHVANWWTESYEGDSQNVGDTFVVRFGETFVKFKVAELIQDKKASWLVTDCNLSWTRDKKEWKDTKLVWELSPSKDGTKVTMTHVGLVPSIECYDECKLGWDFYIAKSLQEFLTTGKGLPDARRRGQ